MRILVVDDSRAMRSLVCRALKAAGYEQLREAGNGAEALQSIDAQPVDFVLTDWNMPEMDGLALVKALQERPSVKVGMVTSECTAEMISTARAAGARFVVNKPFTPEALKQALEQALAS
ncbi:MAG: response regulator [Myxococcaceae bacterium]|jgi:two-component system chemotaxis response regulator CheY|nr:response regulator [Myxococcaceae bacterium]